MREFEHKRKMKKVLSSPLMLIVLAILVVFLSRGVWAIYGKSKASSVELNLSMDRLEKLKLRQESLVVATQELKTETGIEKEIRERLQMAKDGEREIVIVDSPSSSEGFEADNRTFLQKVKDFFTIR